ncbi:hypothetical protein K7X08_024453 [Anisodus acutangulus]|uniref:Uncharacterized protein n=1 Tax=Anisodus acutangulus TaxID=402998 RepID=A0A9Q1RF05_9SOLA|nr:hypothetical protein K7X08_024453 [Anisodus acutangulus]
MEGELIWAFVSDSGMSSSSLVVRSSPLPMKKIFGNCKSLSILSSALAAANSCRSPVKVRKTVAPWLMLLPEFDEFNSIVYKFYRLAERDVKEVVMEDQLMTPDADCLCLGSLFQGWLVYIQQRDWVKNGSLT